MGTRFFNLNTSRDMTRDSRAVLDKIPAVGLGTSQVNVAAVGEAVISAVELGYRRIDCDPTYGNEKAIGLALDKLFSRGVVQRADLCISSKFWCSDDHDPEDVPEAINRTLSDLKLEYLDLYLIHWPCPENLIKTKIRKTWKAMEKLCDSNHVQAIGVSNFSKKNLKELWNMARIPPTVIQVECHPHQQQKELRDFCREKGVHLSAYSLNNEQVALRWGLEMGHSVLLTSVEEWTRENLDV